MLNESKKAAEKALALAPTNERFRSIGATYRYLGEYTEAFNAYELGGQSAYTYERKGDIYLRQGKIDSALKYFNRAIYLEPYISLTGILSFLFTRVIASGGIQFNSRCISSSS